MNMSIFIEMFVFFARSHWHCEHCVTTTLCQHRVKQVDWSSTHSLVRGAQAKERCGQLKHFAHAMAARAGMDAVEPLPNIVNDLDHCGPFCVVIELCHSMRNDRFTQTVSVLQGLTSKLAEARGGELNAATASES